MYADKILKAANIFLKKAQDYGPDPYEYDDNDYGPDPYYDEDYEARKRLFTNEELGTPDPKEWKALWEKRVNPIGISEHEYVYAPPCNDRNFAKDKKPKPKPKPKQKPKPKPDYEREKPPPIPVKPKPDPIGPPP